MLWALLTELIPIYPLYALLFQDAGMSAVQISSLLALWSGISFIAEVPAGALADRHSRRVLIAIADVVRAAGFIAWAVEPTYLGFAIGFLLWGVGGSLISGALEALVYDALAADQQQRHFAAVLGRIHAVGLLAQLPVAAAAAVLYSVGGYALAAWGSAAMSLVGAALALRLPERRLQVADGAQDELSWRATMRDGWTQVVQSATVRRTMIALAFVGAMDAVEEYFALIAHARGLAVEAVPFAVAAIYLVAATCGALASLATQWRGLRLAAWLCLASAAFSLTQLVAAIPATACLALYYGIARLTLVVYEARLQHALSQRSRATATSIASLAIEIVSFGVYLAWAIGQTAGLVVLSFTTALVLAMTAHGAGRTLPEAERRTVVLADEADS